MRKDPVPVWVTVPVPVAGAPTLLEIAPPLTATPSRALGTFALPAALVPIRLPASVLKLVRSPMLSIPFNQTPLWPFPEMTLPFPAWPMELPFAPFTMATPSRTLPSAVVPALSMPI